MIKKIGFILSFSLALGFGAQAQVAVPTLYAEPVIPPGSLIQAEGSSAVYYLAADNKRYVFPNEKTYNTWYADFSQVQVITLEQLQTYMIGGNVTYRPGTRLVKITTDPKTYAVEPGGILRWITSEQVAKDLYGDAWAQRIDDVPDPFFVNYTVSDDDVDSAIHPVGSLISYTDSEDVYLIDVENGTKVRRNVLSLNSNRYRLDYVIHDVDPAISYPAGSDIMEKEDRLVDPKATVMAPVEDPEPDPEPEPEPELPDLAEGSIFVDPRVDVSGDGSHDAPYKTLAEGISNLNPGQTLYLRGDESGLIYTESLGIAGSGGSSNPKTIETYPGEKVIIAMSETLNINGKWWHFKGMVFDNQDRPGYAIVVDGSNNTFENIELMNGTSDGFRLTGSADNTVITGSLLHDFNDCIKMLPGADYSTISNSTIYNCSSDAIEVFAESGTPFEAMPKSVTILGNDIYTDISSETGVNIKGAIGGIISINQIHGFGDGQAILLTNQANSITISDNEIYENSKGIEIRIAVNTPRAIDIFNNLIYDISGDYAFRFKGVDGGLRVIHNTLVDIAGSPFKIEDEGVSSGQIRNNLISNAGDNLVEPTSNKAIVSNNGWFAGAAAGDLLGADNTEGDDAMFAAPESDAYWLQPGSPAIDAGIELGYVGTDFNGNPREVGADPDLGAFELQ